MARNFVMCTGHVAEVTKGRGMWLWWGNTKCIQIWGVNRLGKRPFGRSRRWEDSCVKDLTEIGCKEGMLWEWLRMGSSGVQPSGFASTV